MSELSDYTHSVGTTDVEGATYREQQRMAVPTVARNALDAEDCKELLDMLGLLDAALLLASTKRRPRRTRRARQKRSAVP